MNEKEYIIVPIESWKQIKNICQKAYNNTYGYVEEQFSKLIDIIDEVNNEK